MVFRLQKVRLDGQKEGLSTFEKETSTGCGSDWEPILAFSISGKLRPGRYRSRYLLHNNPNTPDFADAGKSWKEKTGSAEKSTRLRNASFRSEPVSIILKDLGDEDVEAAKVC